MVRPIEIQDNLSKAPFAAREQHLQQANALAAQQQVDAEVAEERALDQSRTVPVDQPSPGQLAVADRTGGGGRIARTGQHQPLVPGAKAKPPANHQNPVEGIDFLA